jgi:hypothetical protein
LVKVVMNRPGRRRRSCLFFLRQPLIAKSNRGLFSVMDEWMKKRGDVFPTVGWARQDSAFFKAATESSHSSSDNPLTP